MVLSTWWGWGNAANIALSVLDDHFAEVWQSEAYDAFRGELTAIIRGGEEWRPEGSEQVVDANCGKRGTFLCPMRSFYYLRDAEFIREVGALFGSMRGA